ncbi:MAG: cytochrome P450 [Rhodospirillaceae bacterium]|nr:cytochrome P450 [Rhodospirillaceae bacterium]
MKPPAPHRAQPARPGSARRPAGDGGVSLDLSRFHENPARELATLAMHMRPIMRVSTGRSAFIHIGHPDTARHVLQTNTANYSKDFSPFAPLVGDSLLAANGEKWRALRTRMQPAFAPSRFRTVAPKAIAAIDRVIDGWMPAVGGGKPIDGMPGMVAATVEFIATALFSLPDDFVTRHDIEAIEVALEHGGRAMHFGAAMGEDVKRRFRVAIGELDKMAARAVAIRRAETVKPDDLLTLLIDAHDDPDFPEMTDKQLRDEIVTFLLTGHETTATALGWTLRHMSRHPAVLAKMREEVLALGNEAPGYDDLKKLPYTTAVFYESMRLRPAVPLLIRVADQDDEIGGMPIRAGIRVGVSILGIHHHPDFWPEAAKFRPERFLDATERQPGSYLAFSAGARSCIGSRLAMIEAPLFLSRLVQRVRLAPAQNPPLVSLSVVTLRPKAGQLIKVERWD